MENWKELEEYNNKYSVSSKGRFKNNIKNKILNLYKVNFGYYQVNIYYNSKTIRKYIHWLVAKSFIENPNNLSQINHKDGNKQNNSIENLEWCNQSYNIKHSYEIGLRKRKEKHIPKDLKKKVISIDINGVETEYISIREAARLINGNQSNISRCCLGIQKTAYNKVWKYK